MKRPIAAIAAALLLSACSGADEAETDSVSTPEPTATAEAIGEPEPEPEPATETTTVPRATAEPGDRIFCSQHEIVAHAADDYLGEVDTLELRDAIMEWRDTLSGNRDLLRDSDLFSYAMQLDGRLISVAAAVMSAEGIGEAVLDVRQVSERIALRCGALTGDNHRTIWPHSG